MVPPAELCALLEPHRHRTCQIERAREARLKRKNVPSVPFTREEGTPDGRAGNPTDATSMQDSKDGRKGTEMATLAETAESGPDKLPAVEK